MPTTLACRFGRHEWIHVSLKEEVSIICFRCGKAQKRSKSKRTRSKDRGR